MRIIKRLILATLISAVIAYEDNVPCILWSPKNYVDSNPKFKESLKATSVNATQLINASLSSNICSAKIIALVDQPGLRNRDLDRFGYNVFSNLKKYRDSANSTTEIKHIDQGVDVQKLALTLVRRCGSVVAFLDASVLSVDDFSGQITPIVAIVQFQKPNGDIKLLKENDNRLEWVINSINEKVQNDYVIIYTSSQGVKL